MSLAGERPSRLWRLLYRIPLHMYNIGLRGWERHIGVQLMKITTKGRRTGKPHSVLVDVISHDQEEDAYYVSSAYGARADWVRNIRADPVFRVQVARRRFDAEARRVPGRDAEEMLMRYIEEHRGYVKGLYKMMGVDLDEISEGELRAILREEMVLEIAPVKDDDL
jgi:deazaflavin-dependent oxidoreductase (nitroreductase family)